MTAIAMIGSATTAKGLCETAKSVAEANLSSGTAYAGAMAVTVSTTIPNIVIAITAIQTVLTPSAVAAGWPAVPTDEESKIRIEDSVQILTIDIPAILASITAAAGGVTPATNVPVNKLGDLSEFITEKFIEPLTF
jgi:hypothetical protein